LCHIAALGRLGEWKSGEARRGKELHVRLGAVGPRTHILRARVIDGHGRDQGARVVEETQFAFALLAGMYQTSEETGVNWPCDFRRLPVSKVEAGNAGG